jgi:uncharacterized membrane protein YoaK (UPF0700 family)
MKATISRRQCFAAVAVATLAVLSSSQRASASPALAKPSTVAPPTFTNEVKPQQVIKSSVAKVVPPKANAAQVISSITSENSKTLSLPFAVTCGVLMAFNAGFTNGCCLRGAFLGMKQAVAAVTGAWTTSAVGVAEGNYKNAFLQLRVLASYIAGSAIGGLSNPFPKAFQLAPMTGPVLLVAAACLFAASVLAGQSDAKSLWVFFLPAIACGIQNSVTSSHTGNLIRSAHFSGISSDIGTYIGQIVGGNTANLQRLKIFLALGAAFWTGGLVSVGISEQFHNTSLAIAAALMALFGVGAMAKSA